MDGKKMKAMICIGLVLTACSGVGPSAIPDAPDADTSDVQYYIAPETSITTEASVPKLNTYCTYPNADAWECFSFKDNQYRWTYVLLTGNATAETQVETGTYSQTFGEITFTPTDWSCGQGLVPFTVAYVLDSQLTLFLATGSISMNPTSTQIAKSVQTTTGCWIYEEDGGIEFVAVPLQSNDGGHDEQAND